MIKIENENIFEKNWLFEVKLQKGFLSKPTKMIDIKIGDTFSDLQKKILEIKEVKEKGISLQNLKIFRGGIDLTEENFKKKLAKEKLDRISIAILVPQDQYLGHCNFGGFFDAEDFPEFDKKEKRNRITIYTILPSQRS